MSEAKARELLRHWLNDEYGGPLREETIAYLAAVPAPAEPTRRPRELLAEIELARQEGWRSGVEYGWKQGRANALEEVQTERNANVAAPAAEPVAQQPPLLTIAKMLARDGLYGVGDVNDRHTVVPIVVLDGEAYALTREARPLARDAWYETAIVLGGPILPACGDGPASMPLPTAAQQPEAPTLVDDLVARLDAGYEDYTQFWGSGNLYGEAAERIRVLSQELETLKAKHGK